MKLHELTINDIIRFCGKPVRVIKTSSEILKDGQYDTEVLVEANDGCRYRLCSMGGVEPIPLTKELIKELCQTKGSLTTIDPLYLDRSEAVGSFLFEKAIPISSVHELQHLLRFYGHREYADNFVARDTQNYITRMIAEKEELDGRIARAKTYLGEHTEQSTENNLLLKQVGIMEDYSRTLAERIALAEDKDK